MQALPRLHAMCIICEYPNFYRAERDPATRDITMDKVEYDVFMANESLIGLHEG